MLGAGFDARAFRLPWPPWTRLFEVDTADVLGHKEAVLAAEAAVPRCERIAVACDLRADWPAALLAAGLRPGQPTAWLAEGLLVYLTPAHVDHVLTNLTRLSVPGSRLGLTYTGPRPALNPAQDPPRPAQDQPRPAHKPSPDPSHPAQHASPDQVHPAQQPDLDPRRPVADTGGHQSWPSRTARYSSAPADPVGWLAIHGWSAQITSAREVLSAHGRPLPSDSGPAQRTPAPGQPDRVPGGLLVSAERMRSRTAP